MLRCTTENEYQSPEIADKGSGREFDICLLQGGLSLQWLGATRACDSDQRVILRC